LESILLVFYIIVGIGAIIFVHELGHFLTAKLAGVRVEAFSLGFYPTLIGARRSLQGLVVGLLPGRFQSPGAEVGGVEEGSPADRAGIRIGDRILEMDGRAVDRLDYEALQGVLGSREGTVALKLLRGKRVFEVTLEPPGPVSSLADLGLFPHLSEQADLVKGDGPAWAFGLREGERVKAAAGQDFENREAFQAFVAEAVSRGAGIVRMEVEPEREDEGSRRIALGVRPRETVPRLAVTLPVFKGVPGETEYRLSLLPIGGYVKMAGDIPGETSGASDEFLGKSVGARGMVFAAGSVMNAIFACVFFILAYQVGVQSVSPLVGDVVPGFPADEAGLQPGDRVTGINGNPVREYFDIPQEVAYADPKNGLRFEVERDGETLILPPPDEDPVPNHYDPEQKRQMAGIRPRRTNRIESMAMESPLYEAGIRPKDRIVELAGTPTEDRDEVVAAFQRFLTSEKETLSVVVERDDRRLPEKDVAVPPDTEKAWRLGVLVQWTFEVEKAPSGGRFGGILEAGDAIRGTGAFFMEEGLSKTLSLLADEMDFPAELPFRVDRGDRQERVVLEAETAEDLRAFADGIETRAFIRVSEIRPRSRLDEAGVPAGASIVEIAGEPFSSQKEVFSRLDEAGEDPVEITWVSEEGERRKTEVSLVPGWKLSLHKMGVERFREDREYLRLPFFASIGVGVKKSIKFAYDVFRTLKGIFITRSIGGESLGGPVMIVVASYHFAEYGFGKLLFFLGIISINLAIINMFPIPILDGGHLAFLFIEKVKGSPVSETGQAIAQYAGLLILLFLMVYVTWNDIGRLLQ